MEKTRSAWVLCPSKKFPARFYYFNTKTQEKVWSCRVPSGQTPDKFVLSTSERPKAQASFGQINFPGNLHISNPRRNQPIQNTLIKSIAVNSSNNTPQSREIPRTRESEQLDSTTTNTNFKLTPPRFKPLRENPFSLSLAECSQADSKLRQESASKKVFNPTFSFSLPLKHRSDTEIDELRHRIKKVKIATLSPKSYIPEQGSYLQHNSNKLKPDVDFEDDKSSLPTPNHLVRNDNVKVSVHFLRNLSTSQHTEAWYLIPDVDVLLNFTFIKEFMAGDRTCSLVIPAFVLAKLKSLRCNDRAADSRATAARQVFDRLAKTHKLCQSDKLDECPLDDLTIYENIIQCCLNEKLFHVVIITKSKILREQAKRNNIHAYYLNELKIIKPSENLFLMDPDSTKTLKLPTAESPLNNTSHENNALESDSTGEENKLKEFCAKYAHFQKNVNGRVDGLICSFLQIIEFCLHNVLKRIPQTEFDPPRWLHHSLEILKKHYSQNKQLCAIVEHLTVMCGFCLKNDVMRPNIKSDQFIEILGVGILLIERLEKISQFAELSDCKEMLNKLITDIQTPEEVLAEIWLDLERCRKLRDDSVVVSTNLLVGTRNIESAPQHEIFHIERPPT